MNFNEQEFLDYCEEQYLNHFCDCEESITIRENGTLRDVVTGMPAFQLAVWLGEYFHKQNDNNPYF